MTSIEGMEFRFQTVEDSEESAWGVNYDSNGWSDWQPLTKIVTFSCARSKLEFRLRRGWTASQAKTFVPGYFRQDGFDTVDWFNTDPGYDYIRVTVTDVED